jgi:hypothetical protein
MTPTLIASNHRHAPTARADGQRIKPQPPLPAQLPMRRSGDQADAVAIIQRQPMDDPRPELDVAGGRKRLRRSNCEARSHMKRSRLKIRRVTHFRIIWRGIKIKIKYQYQLMSGSSYQESSDHISIYVIGPNADLCPLTATGYRSIHISTRSLRKLGGPVAYVTRLLNQSANTPQWIKTERSRRQLDLFPESPRTSHGQRL